MTRMELEIGTFFQIKEKSGLEYSQVNVYDHKVAHLAIKLEAYTSTQTLYLQRRNEKDKKERNKKESMKN